MIPCLFLPMIVAAFGLVGMHCSSLSPSPSSVRLVDNDVGTLWPALWNLLRASDRMYPCDAGVLEPPY